MKRLFLTILFLSFLGFNYDALASIQSPENLPYSYGGVEYNNVTAIYNSGNGRTFFIYCADDFITTNILTTGIIYSYCGSTAGNYRMMYSEKNSSGEIVAGPNASSGSGIIATGYNIYSLPITDENVLSSVNVVDFENYSSLVFAANIIPYQLDITRSPELGGGVLITIPPGFPEYQCGVNSYEDCEFTDLPYNSQVTLEAEANTGYAFSHWEINSQTMGDVDGTITTLMSEDKEVVAVYYLKADDFVFPVLAEGVTNPLQNKFNPIGDGWSGPGVGEYSAAAGHLGQDYVMNYNNGDGNAASEPVYAVANGTIVEVINNQNTLYGWCNDSDHGWGPVVVIRHENRDGFNTSGSIITGSCDTETNPTVIYSLYGHLSKTSIQNLQIGQTVHMGDQLGVAGAYGVDQSSWTTNHLHFELKDEVGYAEGVWYKTPANEGVCPESTNYPCDSYMVKGVGTAYSKENGFAPHRYEPGEFINANKQ